MNLIGNVVVLQDSFKKGFNGIK